MPQRTLNLVEERNVHTKKHVLAVALWVAIMVASAGDVNGTDAWVVDLVGNNNNQVVPPDASRDIIGSQPRLARHVEDVSSVTRAGDVLALKVLHVRLRI